VAPDTGDTGTRPAVTLPLPASPRIALTGTTGFVGGHLLAQLADPGASMAVRALARPRAGRQLERRADLTWVAGDLDQPAALADLCAGSDVVIHLAGATKALHGTGYHAVNAAATARLVRAAAEAGVRHVIHLSSLAATRPGVSDYAASKAAGEVAARAAAAGMALTILRAPAVLGPGDGATRPLFAMLARGWLVVPGGGARQARFSAIDVGDLCRLIVDIARAGADPGQIRLIDPYGWQSLGWDDLAASAARITGRRPRLMALPRPLLRLAGHGADAAARLTRRPQVFSGGKVREMLAGDWIAASPVADPTPLDVTIRRCLAPFLPLGRSGITEKNPPDRGPE
jgi:nucleoside-diphosphate-sugar epimerase